MKKCQCKGCEERSEACHDRCEKYKAWKEERDEVKAWLTEQNGPVVKGGTYYNRYTGKIEPARRGINRRDRIKIKSR